MDIAPANTTNHAWEVTANVLADMDRKTQLTLGELIAQLETSDRAAPVLFGDGPAAPSKLHSYRGHYSDLGLQPKLHEITVERFLSMLRGCVGERFRCYKGGWYTMEADTPLWCAVWGHEGFPIERLDVNADYVSLVTQLPTDWDTDLE